MTAPLIYKGLVLNGLILAILAPLARAWSDGAGCTFSMMESMNPLEAVEHQGGLELSPPPFYIEIEQQCYWRSQPIALTLRSNSSKESFKGFVIQPFIYSGTRRGQRLGQFLRLDDNGSWQQQCFNRKQSVTHSHDEKKKRIQLWWRNDDDEANTVQFVATVVVSLRKFWVKSVISAPIPPCRQQNEIGAWAPEPITPPPPANSFKIDTFAMFNKGQSAFLENSFSNVPDRAKQFNTQFRSPTFSNFLPVEITTRSPFVAPQTTAPPLATMRPQPTLPPPQFATFATATVSPPSFVPITATPSPLTTRRRLAHVIPIPEMDTNRRPNRPQQQFFPQQQTQLQQQQQFFTTQSPATNPFQQQQQQLRPQQQQREVFTSAFRATARPTTTTTFTQRQQQTPFRQQQFQQQQRQRQLQLQRQQQSLARQTFSTTANTCQDNDSPAQCFNWLAFCSSSAYMRTFCRRTCRFC